MLNHFSGLPGWLSGKNQPANAGDAGLISESGRSPGEGNGYPLWILAWRIPWTEKTDPLQSIRSQKSQIVLSDSTTTGHFLLIAVNSDIFLGRGRGRGGGVGRNDAVFFLSTSDPSPFLHKWVSASVSAWVQQLICIAIQDSIPVWWWRVNFNYIQKMLPIELPLFWRVIAYCFLQVSYIHTLLILAVWL